MGDVCVGRVCVGRVCVCVCVGKGSVVVRVVETEKPNVMIMIKDSSL